jgi:hypothetical protein
VASTQTLERLVISNTKATITKAILSRLHPDAHVSQDVNHQISAPLQSNPSVQQLETKEVGRSTSDHFGLAGAYIHKARPNAFPYHALACIQALWE